MLPKQRGKYLLPNKSQLLTGWLFYTSLLILYVRASYLNIEMSKVGRKKKTDIERLQARIWFAAVSEKSALNASQLEIKFTHIMTGELKEESVSKEWYKYADRSRLPIDTHKQEKNLITHVENYYPGTAKWIRSPLWQLLKFRALTTTDAIEMVEKSNSPLRSLFTYDRGEDQGTLTISARNWNTLKSIPSIDAFSFMYMYCKATPFEGEPSTHRLFQCRRWLHDAFLSNSLMKIFKDDFMNIFKRFAPELYDLNNMGAYAPSYDLICEALGTQLFQIEN